jgi:hypothetical protein
MRRGPLLLISGALVAAAAASLFFGIKFLNRNIGSYIAGHYHEYARDANGTRYECSGSPAQVANTLAGYDNPEARAASGNDQYLRYNSMVIVGRDGNRPCSIRVEPLSAGYSNGAYRHLGPGFTPGSPSGSSGGSPGGPHGAK